MSLRAVKAILTATICINTSPCILGATKAWLQGRAVNVKLLKPVQANLLVVIDFVGRRSLVHQ